MLHPRFRRSLSALVAKIVFGSLFALALCTAPVPAQILVGDPFISSYEGWIDPVPARGGNWRISLHRPTIMETANTTPAGSNPAPAEDNGSYFPMILVQNNFTTPSSYDLNARMYTTDDDLMGLVFAYQNPDNYYRVGLRNQTPGNAGGTSGLSVQKVSGGVVTQISPNGVGPGVPVITQAMIDNRDPIDVKVAVSGTNYQVFFNGMSTVTGSDPALSAGKIGIQSWAQRVEAITNSPNIWPHWGTEVETISVTQGANTLYSGTFSNNNLPVSWRQVVMTNAAGATTLTTADREDIGNFGVDVNDNWIYHQTNGFENASATAPNVDFISPAVVVNDPGSNNFSNYQMQVRMGSADNDVYGVLVRVQNDNNFYRVSFHSDTAGIGTTRPPRGMSVQKVLNGVWTELYRDNQSSIPFVPPTLAGATPATGLPMFDVSVDAVGNTLKVQVRDQNGNVVNYPLITDSNDPILTGSVGFHDWGSENTYYMGYGGLDGPLLTAISVDAVVNRATGQLTLTNNSSSPVNISGVSILSSGGGLNASAWTSISNTYDEPPGNGEIDPDDPWTVTSSTPTNLSEAEQSGGNGGRLNAGQSITLGNVWVKSRIEDIGVGFALVGGGTSIASVKYTGTPFGRSDLNVDGLVNASDWPLFYPNLLKNLSSLSGVGKALAGDLDSDGDNDVNDFTLFKTDFDVANGSGAFEAMIASLPEPSTTMLVALGGLVVFAFRRRPNRHFLIAVWSISTFCMFASDATAAAVDFTTFAVENLPHADSDADTNTDFFPLGVWTTTATTATHNVNADASVLYAPDSALNKRYIGRLTPGTDDDVVGIVFGIEPGDGQIGSSADYLLIDWKGVTQNFDFVDFGSAQFFHDQTPAGDMPVGLALSRVTGSPTDDELWQHDDYTENPSGAITELARGTTLGSTPYNRAGGSHLFDIRYTATNVTVLVDGVEQFNQSGSFPDGSFGVYTLAQGPPASFSNFEVLSTAYTGLSATVDRSNGNITLRNAGGIPVEFDYYQFNSASNSLNANSWNSLSDQNFQPAGAGAHQKWQEAGGSNASVLAEAFLAGMSTLAGNGSITIGGAYNNIANGEDLVLNFRLPSGLVLQGAVQYIGTAPILQGDYNTDGVVDAADYVVWRKTDNTTAGYNLWRTNFGRTAGGGAALNGAASVPEPASIVLILAALILRLAPSRGR